MSVQNNINVLAGGNLSSTLSKKEEFVATTVLATISAVSFIFDYFFMLDKDAVCNKEFKIACLPSYAATGGIFLMGLGTAIGAIRHGRSFFKG